jgi:hypothetical protein
MVVYHEKIRPEQAVGKTVKGNTPASAEALEGKPAASLPASDG